jgi:hypothetical protein
MGFGNKTSENLIAERHKSITRVSEFPVMNCLIFAISLIKAVIFPI